MNKSLDDIIKERKTASRQTRTGKGPRGGGRGGRGGGRGGNRGNVQASNFNNFQRNEPLVNTRSPLNKRVSQSPIVFFFFFFFFFFLFIFAPLINFYFLTKPLNFNYKKKNQ
mgnify:CR=1 FL=1